MCSLCLKHSEHAYNEIKQAMQSAIAPTSMVATEPQWFGSSCPIAVAIGNSYTCTTVVCICRKLMCIRSCQEKTHTTTHLQTQIMQFVYACRLCICLHTSETNVCAHYVQHIVRLLGIHFSKQRAPMLFSTEVKNYRYICVIQDWLIKNISVTSSKSESHHR